MRPLVLIAGPTASGKTDLSFELARMSGGAVLNADSVQIYRDLNIGSAKPDFSRWPGVESFLFNEVSAPGVWTAGSWRRAALKIIERERPRQTMFISGGSGFYIQALEKGMYPVKPVAAEIEQSLKRREREEGPGFFYRELKRLEPEEAESIGPSDRFRLFRALAVRQSEGRSLSQIKKEFCPKPLPICKKIGLKISRDDLLSRIRARTEKMISGGLIEEAESLLERGFAEWRPLQSLGCREAVLYLKGRINREELFSEIVRSSMALAKRQKTWFKKDKSIQWIEFQKKPSEVFQDLFGQGWQKKRQRHGG